MTTYTVALTFDSEGARKLYNMQKEIANRCGNRFVVDNVMPPHITLSLFDAERPPVEALRAFAAEAPPVDLTFASFGVFNNDAMTVYAAPIVTDELRALHRALQRRLEPVAASFGQNYVEPRWAAHCTLALYLRGDERDAAVRAATETFAPMDARGVAVAVVEYPYQVVEGFLLAGVPGEAPKEGAPAG